MVVMGMASCVVVSRASRERERCRRIPGTPSRLRGAVTSITVCSVASRPQCAAALRWLRTAPAPQASTAASLYPSARSARWPGA